MRRPILTAAAAAVALALVAAYAISPYLAMGALRAAAVDGDRDRLEELVDFPRVRESLKADLNAALLAKMKSDPDMRDNPFAGLGLALAPMIVDRTIDAYVTPAGLAQLADSNRAAQPAPDQPAPSTPAVTSAAPAQAGPAAGAVAAAPARDRPKIVAGYRGLNRFRVVQTQDGQSVTWIFNRQGLFGWKLVRLELPANIFASGPDEAAAEAPAAAPDAVPETPPETIATEADLPAVGSCSDQRVASIATRLEGVPDSGSAITYDDGRFQVSYNTIPEIDRSEIGDTVRLCVVSVPQDCPAGDYRGIMYSGTNLRTGEIWSAPDSSHGCGGP